MRPSHQPHRYHPHSRTTITAQSSGITANRSDTARKRISNPRLVSHHNTTCPPIQTTKNIPDHQNASQYALNMPSLWHDLAVSSVSGLLTWLIPDGVKYYHRALPFQPGAPNKRSDELKEIILAFQANVSQRIDNVQVDLRERLEGMREDLGNRLDDVEERLDAADTEDGKIDDDENATLFDA